jgi:CRP-like cAMP-binding protein
LASWRATPDDRNTDDRKGALFVNGYQELETRLEGIPLFARCHRGDLRVIARRCELRDVRAGTTLIRAGELGDELFVMLTGSAERRRPGETVRTFGPGDYFGELAVLDPAPRSLDVVTTSECLVGVLSRASFLLVLDAVPGVWPQLLAFLARRLRDADLREDHEGQATPA